MNALYFENAQLIWYNDADQNPDFEQALREVIRQQEPTFLYRCGERTLQPPANYYWRMSFVADSCQD
jgi:hypothetical protein